jgi:hypothetical protein
MKIFPIFLFMILIFFLIVGGIIALIVNFLSMLGATPGSKGFQDLLAKFSDQIKELRSTLTPWESDSLSLLSLHKVKEKSGSLFGGIEKGIFTSIYQEPQVAYAVQRANNAGIAVAATANNMFVYRTKNRQTEIWVDNQPLGTYVDGNLLSSTGKLLTQVNDKEQVESFPTIINNQTIASITNPALTQSVNPRAISLLSKPSEETEKLLLAITLLKMLENNSK